MNKINPLNSIGNSINFMLLVLALTYMADSLFDVVDKVTVFNIDGPAFTMASMFVFMAVANMVVHSKPIQAEPMMGKKIIQEGEILKVVKHGKGFAVLQKDGTINKDFDKVAQQAGYIKIDATGNGGDD